MRRSYRDFLLLLFIAAFCRKISSRGELLQQREQRFAPDAQIVHPIVAGIVLVDEAAFLNQGPFGHAPFILTVDRLGWLCYSFLYDLCLAGYLRLITLNAFIEVWNAEKHGNENVYESDSRQYNSNDFPDPARAAIFDCKLLIYP